jgi:hypothetical protein
VCRTTEWLQDVIAPDKVDVSPGRLVVFRAILLEVEKVSLHLADKVDLQVHPYQIPTSK